MKLPIPLPTELLSAHDEGRLVFFCGAGISRYTGLGDFRGLVAEIFEKCGLPLPPESETDRLAESEPDRPEEKAYYQEAYDRALHLLEIRSDGMRPAAMEVLGRRSTVPELRTHKALLSLSRHGENGHRLVTTNFDRRFEEAEPSLLFQAGPLLTLPRPENWRHLTYLHGRLDPEQDPNGLDLVLTSGDFSRAYLQEGWAARFALHLFETYTLLFVGYSLNDPVVSYLIDGLTADMRRRGTSLKAYILTDHDGTENNRREVEARWISRGLIPLPYDSKNQSHSDLHETLFQWAELDQAKRNGNFETLLSPFNAPYDPTTLNRENLDALLWFLFAENGAIAEAFANKKPPVDITWLQPIMEYTEHLQVQSNSLVGFGAEAPVTNAPHLSRVTPQLGKWLAQHRDKTELVNWVINRGARLPANWTSFFEKELETITEPYASFWRLLLDPAVHRVLVDHTVPFPEVTRWPYGSSKDLWPPTDLNLLAAARPSVTLESASWRNIPGQIQHLHDLVSCNIQLTNRMYAEEVWNRRSDPQIRTTLLRNAEALTELLSEALRLERRLSDSSSICYSCLSPIEPSNHEYENISSLVCLCVAAFEAAREDSPTLTKALTWRWLALAQGNNLALFKRMALYALAFIQPVPVDEELALLLDEDGGLLWDDQALDELKIYLQRRAASLPQEAIDRLITTIASGPAQETEGGTESRDQDSKGRRLVMLADAGVPLPDHLALLMEETRARMGTPPPPRKNLEAERMVPAVDPNNHDLFHPGIVECLCKNHSTQEMSDLWRELCGNHPEKALTLLPNLAERCPGSSPLWHGLSRFQKISEEALQFKIVQTLDTVFSQRPERFGWPLAREISGLLATFAPSIPPEGATRAAFLALWNATWKAALTDDASGLLGHPEDYESAINPPAHGLAAAALDLALRARDQIPTDVMPLLDLMVTGDTLSHRYSRIILASRLSELHQKAETWTNQHFIRRITTNDSTYLPMWQVFLLSRPITKLLMNELREGFPFAGNILKDQEELEKWNDNFIEMLIEAPIVFTEAEISRVMKHATGADLGHMAERLAKRLNHLANDAPTLWQSTICAIIEKHWPSTFAQRTAENIDGLLRLAVATRSKFPDAIDLMLKRKLIGPVNSPLPTFEALPPRPNADLDPCASYPDAVLSVLDAVVNDGNMFAGRTCIPQILGHIAKKHPDLTDDPRLRRLQRRVPK